MLSKYLWRLKSAVQNGIKRTEYRFHDSLGFLELGNLQGLLETGAFLAARSDSVLANRRRDISVVGAFSRTISVPSVSGPAFQVCGYHIDRALADSSQIRPSVRKFQSKPLADSGNRVVFCEYLVDTFKSKHGNSSCTVLEKNGVLFGYRSLVSCVKACMRLKDHAKHNITPIYGYFMFSVRKRWCDFNPCTGSGSCDFLGTLPSCLGGLSAPDVNSSGSEEEVVYSVSLDRKDSTGKSLKLLSGSCYLPHPGKEDTGGEDAHFICIDEQAVGVADGVGGWTDLGVDSGQYSRELMSNSVAAIQEEPKGSVDPARVLEKAHFSTKAKGSSTACIIALTDQGLHAVNLGDSGFMVVRDGSTIFRSPVQQHGFNLTYQLGNGSNDDLPCLGQVFSVPVVPQDVVIAGTDGLFDNLYNNEITAVAVQAVRAGLAPQVTAQHLAVLARQRAQDRDGQTPFSTAAQDAGYRHHGGKLDDITVVVSYII